MREQIVAEPIIEADLSTDLPSDIFLIDLINQSWYSVFNKGEDMPRRRTSLKSQRKDKRRRLRNLKIKRDIKKAIKKFRTSLLAKNITEAGALLPSVSSASLSMLILSKLGRSGFNFFAKNNLRSASVGSSK